LAGGQLNLPIKLGKITKSRWSRG